MLFKRLSNGVRLRRHPVVTALLEEKVQKLYLLHTEDRIIDLHFTLILAPLENYSRD